MDYYLYLQRVQSSRNTDYSAAEYIAIFLLDHTIKIMLGRERFLFGREVAISGQGLISGM